MDYKDYYATLKVAKDASQEDVQKAYRKLARKFHPDVNKAADAETRFKEIGEAYEVLKDPDKRQKYDQYGSAWKSAQQTGGTPPGWEHFGGGDGGFDFSGMGGMGGGEGFSSFFDMLFGGGAGRRGAPGFGGGMGRRHGADAEAQISISLEEAILGGSRQISLTDPNTGKQSNLTIRIPKGVRGGQRIRLAGRGQAGSDGGAAGDLYLRIEVEPDPRFRIEGTDLYTQLPVSPWEAALGTDATVETPEEGVRVKVPAGSSTGRKIRLRRRGLPQQGGERGDLYAEVRIVIPPALSPRERELFQELAEVSTFKARVEEEEEEEEVG